VLVDDEEGKDMTMPVILILLLFPLVVLEFAFSKSQWTQKILYQVAFFVTFFMVVIKYYYGSDITLYVPLYRDIDDFSIWGNVYFEPGFLFFLKCCKAIGMSFWWMTAVITCFYFWMLWRLFEHIPKYKVLALLILVAFDYNLLFFELRQCIAVSLFIGAYLLYKEGKFVRTFLCLAAMVFCHKSGLFMVLIFSCAVAFSLLKVKEYWYTIALVVMLLLLLLPVEDFLIALLDSDDKSAAAKSIIHHLLVVDSFQLINVMYFMLAVLLFFVAKSKSNTFDGRLVFISFILIELLVKYWFLLNRLRSYFLPIMLVYIFQHIDAVKGIKWYKQLMCIMLLLFIGWNTRALYRTHQASISKLGEPQTIFKLLQEDEKTILESSIKKAKLFWKEEYIK
jgi:hypothetical protein